MTARNNGAGGSWQFLVPGMEEFNDDFGIIPRERPSIDRLIKEQSCCLMALRLGREEIC
ncbi:putative Mannan endo-1,4-beta-mannosidase 5 [Cocos nucifera]|uniref:Putative Mannan endo-1,4-beta-mannosidase 5 n=1 Tax=Cocos nucifera TaxID=13894 RepID=A0A8K0MW27_COCNU|nr:putative Mannan endo-1,4-beta-mannosidase 5 [Cocos nucifera]